MKKLFLTLSLIIFSSLALACVDPNNPATYGSSVTGTPSILNVIDDTLLCTGTYNTRFIIAVDDVTLDCDGSTLSGGNLYNGVSLYQKEYVTIKNCFIEKFNNGISMLESNHNLIKDNTLNNNTIGLPMQKPAGLFMQNVTNNTVIGNTMANNNRGVRMLYATENEFIDNLVEDNSYGFELWLSSSNNIFHGNTILNSEHWGAHVSQLSNDNLFYNNYFENDKNAFSHLFVSNYWNIEPTLGTNIIGGPYLGGNYWSDYLGEDTDLDGLGDTLLPYDQNWIYVGGDYHPLVELSCIPEEEICDGLDNDCDGDIDEDLTFDEDGDGFTSLASCFGSKDDCDDTNPEINPDGTDIPGNELDEDCDGSALADPNAEWKNHGQYVSSVVHEAKQLHKNNEITKEQRKQAVRDAAHKNK